VLISLNGNALIEDTEITLNFKEASLDGSAGCNTYRGSYTASEDSLRLSGVYWTEIGCPEPEGILDQEKAYFDALNAAARYRVDGDRLEVYDEAGTQILAFVASTSEALAEEEMPMRTTPRLSLDCTLEMDETYPVGEPVNLRFELHNQTDRPLYVLNWYTPLEGIAGEIFQVTRNGEELLYQGMLAKRGDPTREEYIAIEPGEVTSAEVDLRTGYDLSTPGSYQVQFTTGLQDVTDDASLVPRKRDDHRPQSLSCNTVSFGVVPTPERSEARPTDVPPAATPTPEPPAGFKRYVDASSGVSLWVPESWSTVEPGPHGGPTILQSYPKDKYVGGEPRQPGDTKCDLTVHPPYIGVADVVPQNRSDPPVTVVAEQEIILQSGRPGMRFEVESMGRSLSLVTEINERVVVLTCFGEFEPFDAIAVTLGSAGAVEGAPPPTIEPPAGFKPYQDPVTGVSVYVPESWVVTGVVPGQFAILQSYPEDKYVGGEALKPGDTKCDLIIRPPDVDIAAHIQQLQSEPTVTIVSRDGMVLQSGRPGSRFEVESMGRSLSLITEINRRVVVLTCFGDLAPFEEIAVTLGAGE
jgi:heat shock protein HslJ